MAASEPPASPTMKKAVKIEMVKEGGTLEEKFRLLRSLGFDGVELPSPNAWNVEEVVAASKATGLPVHGVVCSEHWKSPLNDSNPEVRAKCVAAIREAISDAKAYGASSVAGGAGRGRKESLVRRRLATQPGRTAQG